MSEGKILCAVDFGTTYSGVAYAYVEEGAKASDVEMELIEDHWPGRATSSSPKVPTVFKYDKTAPGGFKWGFELDDDPDRICFSKLYLDPTQIEKAERLAQFSKRLGKLPPNRQISDAVSRYLSALREVALDRMKADWGEDFQTSTPIEYILTVPAVWSDKAKSDTLYCASQAGFGSVGKIRLITEPEAAAIYTLHQLPDFMVKKGDVFITCDCGGGTVDLTTYMVSNTDPHLRVNELTMGSGGLCGSVYLNKRFEELVRGRIGKQVDALSKSEALEAMDEMQRIFNDEIKPAFGKDDDMDKVYYVPVPAVVKGTEEAQVEDSQLAVTAADLRDQVFEPVIRQILQHITGQLERVEDAPGSPSVAAILLVGGFGSSTYLRKRVESHFDGEDLPKIKVIQPVNAWSAVTLGALLRGIEGGIVETRIIRAAYGVQAREPWTPEVHEQGELKRTAEKNKAWSDIEGEWKCDNIVSWYVKKSEAFTNEKIVVFPFYRALSSLDDLVFRTNLISYAGDDEKPPYFINPDTKVVGTLVSDLSKIPKEKFEVTHSSRGSYYKIWYQVEMRFEAMITFRLRFDGETLGEIALDYSHSR